MSHVVAVTCPSEPATFFLQCDCEDDPTELSDDPVVKAMRYANHLAFMLHRDYDAKKV
jgi:hypothetical protein